MNTLKTDSFFCFLSDKELLLTWYYFSELPDAEKSTRIVIKLDSIESLFNIRPDELVLLVNYTY